MIGQIITAIDTTISYDNEKSPMRTYYRQIKKYQHSLLQQISKRIAKRHNISLIPIKPWSQNPVIQKRSEHPHLTMAIFSPMNNEIMFRPALIKSSTLIHELAHWADYFNGSLRPPFLSDETNKFLAHTLNKQVAAENEAVAEITSWYVTQKLFGSNYDSSHHMAYINQYFDWFNNMDAKLWLAMPDNQIRIENVIETLNI